MGKHSSSADLRAVGVGCQNSFDVSPSRSQLVECQVEAGPQDSDQLHHRHPPHLHEPVALHTIILLLGTTVVIDVHSE